jgi:hypothetical protein
MEGIVMGLDEAIKHCLEVAEQNETSAITYKNCKEIKANMYEKLTAEKAENDCRECAADHRQLAEWLTELKQWRRVYGICPSYEMCIPECKEGYDAQIAEYKRLLKLAVEDFAKLDRVNTKVRNCMIPDMDCADCPLSWDSVDDSVEPCHSWRYTNEALKLIGDENDAE